MMLIAGAMIFTISAQENMTTTDKSLITKVTEWYQENTNYATITTLMAVESSFIPFPSEVIIPPAAYIACEPDSDLNIFLVVLFGTLGALIGALINYYLSLFLGRPIIYKFADSKIGHLLLINREKLEKAENYFNSHGAMSTLIGRLIPAIRQLISIPAGLVRMNIITFSLFTSLGALVWNCVLALLGYLTHGQKDLIDKYNHELSIIILVLFALFILYLIVKSLIKKRRK